MELFGGCRVVVPHADCAVEYALGCGIELDLDGAICSRSDAAGTVVRWVEWARRRKLAYEQDSEAGVGERHGFCQTASKHYLVWKRQARGGERHCGQHSDAFERKHLRAVGSIVRAAYSGFPAAGSCGREGYGDVASAARWDRCATVIFLNKVGAVQPSNID